MKAKREQVNEEMVVIKLFVSNYARDLINRRINKLNISINTAKEVCKDEYIIIAIDGTGIKVTNRG